MTDVDSEGGLRERKRLIAMTRVQGVALDLFEVRGFGAVTVEEIAEASDVSPSSVYRYFGTKEEIVLWDATELTASRLLPPALAQEIPLDGVRHLVLGAISALSREGERQLRRRVALMMSTPELEQAGSARMYAFAEHIGKVLADRMGRDMSDLDVQVFSHALSGGLLGMVHHWHGTGFAEPLHAVAARVFDIVGQGLDVVTSEGWSSSRRDGSAAT